MAYIMSHDPAYRSPFSLATSFALSFDFIYLHRWHFLRLILARPPAAAAASIASKQNKM